MGKLKNNLIIQGMSGNVGGILLKHYAYGTVISRMPDRSKVKLTEHQKKLNTKFQEAVFFARDVIRNPEKRKQYEKQSRREKRAVYHIALSEYLKTNKLKDKI